MEDLSPPLNFWVPGWHTTRGERERGHIWEYEIIECATYESSDTSEIFTSWDYSLPQAGLEMIHYRQNNEVMWGLRCSDEANAGKYLFCIAKTNMETSRYIIIKSRQCYTLSLSLSLVWSPTSSFVMKQSGITAEFRKVCSH